MGQLRKTLLMRTVGEYILSVSFIHCVEVSVHLCAEAFIHEAFIIDGSAITNWLRLTEVQFGSCCLTTYRALHHLIILVDLTLKLGE